MLIKLCRNIYATFISLQVKSALEEETDETYSEFTPVLYMKLDGKYIVKVINTL